MALRPCRYCGDVYASEKMVVMAPTGQQPVFVCATCLASAAEQFKTDGEGCPACDVALGVIERALDALRSWSSGDGVVAYPVIPAHKEHRAGCVLEGT